MIKRKNQLKASIFKKFNKYIPTNLIKVVINLKTILKYI